MKNSVLPLKKDEESCIVFIGQQPPENLITTIKFGENEGKLG